jgi:hypothetical protein
LSCSIICKNASDHLSLALEIRFAIVCGLKDIYEQDSNFLHFRGIFFKKFSNKYVCIWAIVTLITKSRLKLMTDSYLRLLDFGSVKFVSKIEIKLTSKQHTKIINTKNLSSWVEDNFPVPFFPWIFFSLWPFFSNFRCNILSYWQSDKYLTL